MNVGEEEEKVRVAVGSSSMYRAPPLREEQEEKEEAWLMVREFELPM